MEDADATSQVQNKARRSKQWNDNSVFHRLLGRVPPKTLFLEVKNWAKLFLLHVLAGQT